jgi:hypothetical protein
MQFTILSIHTQCPKDQTVTGDNPLLNSTTGFLKFLLYRKVSEGRRDRHLHDHLSHGEGLTDLQMLEQKAAPSPQSF